MSVNKNKTRERKKENLRWLERKNVCPEGMRLCVRCGNFVTDTTNDSWKHRPVNDRQHTSFPWSSICYTDSNSISNRRQKKRRESEALRSMALMRFEAMRRAKRRKLAREQRRA